MIIAELCKTGGIPGRPMIAITDPNALVPYLRDRNLVPAGESPGIRVLAGGVSCDVVRVDTNRDSFVLKQACPRLRVQEDWFSD